MSTPTPKVFLSYSHDSEPHAERVRSLADRLRADGIDCAIDQYEPAPPQGWPLWMDHQVEDADFVLVVSTETYLRQATGREPPGVGHGVRFESVLIVQDLYDAGMWNEKFIPVLFEGARREDIVKPLRPYTYYRADTEEGYEALYRRLTGQPLVRKPEFGLRRTLPPRNATTFSGVSTDPDPETTSLEAEAMAPPKDRVGLLAPSVDGAEAGTSERKPLWQRWQSPVVFMGAVLAIAVALLGIATAVLDLLPTKVHQFWKEVGGQDAKVIEQTLTGEIQDAETKKPLAGVEVWVPKYKAETITDDNGIYQLTLTAPKNVMVRWLASKPGYKDLNDDLTIGTDQPNIHRMYKGE